MNQAVVFVYSTEPQGLESICFVISCVLWRSTIALWQLIIQHIRKGDIFLSESPILGHTIFFTFLEITSSLWLLNCDGWEVYKSVVFLLFLGMESLTVRKIIKQSLV